MGVVASKDSFRALGDAIRERRTQRDLTQEDVAHAAGISLRHYQKLEGGSINPRLQTLLDLAAALDTRVQRLLDQMDEGGRGRAKR